MTNEEYIERISELLPTCTFATIDLIYKILVKQAQNA